MKKEVILILALVLVYSILVGCGSLGLPARPSEEKTETTPVPETPVPPSPAAAQEPIVEEVIAAQNATEEAINMTPEIKISGSTELQKDQTLCPHLKQDFDCDRYDVRGCQFKQRIGDNGFFPDYMICHPGDTSKGESQGKRYCFIQECGPIVEGNVATEYGGIVAYAEYGYRLEKTETGIMTYYDLERCGEKEMKFNSKEECRWYYSEWRTLWG